MPIVVEAGAAAARRTAVVIKDYTNTENEDENYYATLYMGAPPDTADEMKSGADDKSLPQAYLVEQPPHATVPPHFHDTDQFQVFVHGKANFGKQQVLPLSVHYAGGHTPYGPIVTDQEGAHYFTLRANWDSGGKPMPASRNLLKRGQQCHRFAEVSDALSPSTMAAVDCDPLFPVEGDGLGASMLHAASRRSWAARSCRCRCRAIRASDSW